MKKTVAIVGGGSSALMLGCELNNQTFDVSIYESNYALGRKFLVAGEGGLNLTHSENESDFLKRYTPSSFLENAFRHFSNNKFIKWLNESGIKTFIGSSGRVFPEKGIKPAQVLNVFLEKIRNNKVNINTKYKWNGFTEQGSLRFEHNGQTIEVKSDFVIFCLGGASWPVTGSKGDWSGYFTEKGICVNSFKASNCAFQIKWEESLLQKIEGKPLKNVSISSGDKTHFGEVVITQFGIEGSGIYPLSPEIRSQLETQGFAEIFIDFKPQVSLEKLTEKIKDLNKKDFTRNLKTELALPASTIQLIKTHLSKDNFTDPEKLAKKLKKFNLNVTGTAPVEEAISTVGGICLNEIDDKYQLKKLPNHFAIGEMLDYDAPTGGYLLQSCFSMAKYLAYNLNNQVSEQYVK